MADPAHAPALSAARSRALNGTPPKPRVTTQELLEALAHWQERPMSAEVNVTLYQHATAFFDVQSRITPAMINHWNG